MKEATVPTLLLCCRVSCHATEYASKQADKARDVAAAAGCSVLKVWDRRGEAPRQALLAAQGERGVLALWDIVTWTIGFRWASKLAPVTVWVYHTA